MKLLSITRAAFQRHWAPIPKAMRSDFNRHVRLTNARRLNVTFAVIILATMALASLRAIMAGGGEAPAHHALFLTMGEILVASTLTLMLIHQRIDSETMKRAHALLLGAAIASICGALAVIAGIEYSFLGSITRFYLAIFGVCTALILTPASLILSLAWATLCLLATVWGMEGTLTPFFLGNMHPLGLFLMSGVISRTLATTFTRDYLLLKEVEHSNREMRREIHEREKIMRRLARSEQEFKNTFEYAPDAYILTDPSGTVSRLNRAAHDLIGKTHPETQHKPPHEMNFLGENNLPLAERILHETSLFGRSGPCELQKIVLTDGQPIHLELHASTIHLEEREMVLTIARDITQRKEGEILLEESRQRLEERVLERTEELEHINIRLKNEITERIGTEAALAKAETHYRLLVENMNEGLAIFDPEGRFTYMNDYLCTMTGYSRETLMGKKHTFVVAREDRPVTQTQQNKRLQGGDEPYEARLATASGEILHTHISPQPMVDEKGDYKGRFVVVTNITGLKKMGVALRRSEERSRALLNSSGDAAMLVTPSGILLEANEIACQLLNTPRAELVGRSILDGFPKTIPARQVVAFKQALKRGAIEHFEDQMLGEKNHYHITLHPIGHQNRVDRVAIFARNITELKAAEKHIRTLSQELIKAQENERQRIARDLHDHVAQDLATLKIGWDTLLHNLTEEDPAFRKKTRSLSRLLRGSIESIRDLAYNLQPPELEQLGLITAIRRYCEEQAVHINLSIDLFTAGVKELQLSFDTQINLYRLVQEALSNVRKHAEASRVTIHLTASHPNLILRVEDNGKGFHVKERLTEAIHEKRMGVRSMEERVSLLKGTMKLTSSLGAGTRLRIEVPAKQKRPSRHVA